MRSFFHPRLSALICGLILFVGLSCGRKPESVVLYTSVDDPVARPIIKAFEDQTGIRVTLVTDAEATKTSGLVEKIRAEKVDPQCDVYWGNEPFNTINLGLEGLLAPYDAPSAHDVPSQYKDGSNHLWASNGLRARVIAVNTAATSSASTQPVLMPSGIEDLGEPDYKNRVVLSRPVGTVAGHVAALYVLWGEPRADSFFNALKGNGVKLVGGNSVVAESVGNGSAVVGITDNDDVDAVNREGSKITRVIPDQNSFGTLLIPTTVALVNKREPSEAAKKLADYLLSSGVEKKMIDAKFVGWSVRTGDAPKGMAVDYTEVAKMMPEAIKRVLIILEGR